MANRIAQSIRAVKVPVYAYIRQEVLGVANLVVLSCDAIHMAPGASLGDAVVRKNGGEIGAFGYQERLHKSLYSLCRAKGLSTAFVSALMGELGNQEGKPTLLRRGLWSAPEALSMGLCHGISDEIEDLVAHELGTEDYLKYEPATHRGGFLLYYGLPLLACWAVGMMMVALYHFLREPKVGYPFFLFLGLLAGWGLYYHEQGTLSTPEIAIGGTAILVLVSVELIWLPFFYFLGYAAIALLPVWHFFAANDNPSLYNFNYAYHLPELAMIGYLFADILLFSLLFFFFHEHLLGERLFKALFIWREHSHQRGVSAHSRRLRREHTRSLVGVVGTAATMLRPAGKVRIGTRRYYAAAPGYVRKGAFVGVVAVRDDRHLLLEVVPIDTDLTDQQ